jgi:hypothetical protein
VLWRWRRTAVRIVVLRKGRRVLAGRRVCVVRLLLLARRWDAVRIAVGRLLAVTLARRRRRWLGRPRLLVGRTRRPAAGNESICACVETGHCFSDEEERERESAKVREISDVDICFYASTAPRLTCSPSPSIPHPDLSHASTPRYPAKLHLSDSGFITVGFPQLNSDVTAPLLPHSVERVYIR